MGVGVGPARGGGGGRGSACQEPKPAATRSGEMIASVEPTAMSVGVCGVQSSSQTPARSHLGSGLGLGLALGFGFGLGLG